jgi:hypothetical protein
MYMSRSPLPSTQTLIPISPFPAGIVPQTSPLGESQTTSYLSRFFTGSKSGRAQEKDKMTAEIATMGNTLDALILAISFTGLGLRISRFGPRFNSAAVHPPTTMTGLIRETAP